MFGFKNLKTSGGRSVGTIAEGVTGPALSPPAPPSPSPGEAQAGG